MNAKKALSKLKKKSVKKLKSKSLKQLEALKSHTNEGHNHAVVNSKPLSNELKKVANQAAMSVLNELAAPLSPVFSWLNNGGQGSWNPDRQNYVRVNNSKQLSNGVGHVNPSIARLPLKSPPCKRCPALANGICKCAARKFRLTA